MPIMTPDEFDLDIRLGPYDADGFPEAATRPPVTRVGSWDYCCTDNCCTTTD
ncbi:hypothetical protein GCM10009745_57220 [Kribbella yunnanensis]|uniref:GE37468 family thiazolyl peptide n=1 Tax=Kribbella yunnanensis TaxID=190194 RepID=A0ABN2ICK4_9ACTN